MVSHPVHVSVCPSPALGLGWFGHRSVAPPAAPVCWALLVSVAPFCRLGFSCASLGFFLWRLLDLGGSAAVLPGFLLSFSGELSFPCPGRFRLAVPTVWLSRLLGFFLSSFLGFFLSLPVFC